jgi:hypothetical protein
MACAVGWLLVLQPSRKEKKCLTFNQPNTGTDIEDGENGEGTHGPGEFDQDEPEEVLSRVKASKSLARQDQASAGTASGLVGYQSRATTPAIRGGGPPVARKTEQVRIELLRLVHNSDH